MGLVWCLPVAMIFVTGLFVGSGWIVTVSWTLALIVMGVACIANARGCGEAADVPGVSCH